MAFIDGALLIGAGFLIMSIFAVFDYYNPKKQGDNDKKESFAKNAAIGFIAYQAGKKMDSKRKNYNDSKEGKRII